MKKGNAALRYAAQKKAEAPRKRGRPPKKVDPDKPVDQDTPERNEQQGFPVLIPDMLRTCLMARDDVEVAVRKAVKDVMGDVEERMGQRKVPLSEAMERLNVKSRSTMWHWNESGYLIAEHDERGHVFYRDYKIRRAEIGLNPEGGDEDEKD